MSIVISKIADMAFAVRAIELSSNPYVNLTHQAITDILGHGSLKMLQEHYAKWIKSTSVKRNRFLDVYADNVISSDTNKDEVNSIISKSA